MTRFIAMSVVLLAAGCATAPPLAPVNEMAPVHLCYEFLLGQRGRMNAVSWEIQRRGIDCNDYLNQMTLIARQERARQEEEQRRREAIAAAWQKVGDDIRQSSEEQAARNQELYKTILQNQNRSRQSLDSNRRVCRTREFLGQLETVCEDSPY